jgi:hypothetical protein
MPARGRQRLLQSEAHNKAPRPANRSSGPWGHSLETEERTNAQPLVPAGDPKIYDRWSERLTE